MNERLPISVCMIAGAEAHRIRLALDSVSDWVQEIIVVVNDEVSDGTPAVASAYGAQVFREPWKGHIAQKNSAAEKAGQEWLLGLDADEVVSPALRADIQAAIRMGVGKNAPAAFAFPRCTQFAGKWIRHGDWYPDRQTRLWRRGQARWGGIDPHDRLEVNGSVDRLRGELLHYSMETFDHQVQKAIKFSDIFAQECLARQRRVRFAEVVFRPWWRFFRCYIAKLGFLDGWQGYVIAAMTFFYTFLRYLKAWETQNRLRKR